MKKLIALLLIGIMMFSLASCGKDDDAPPPELMEDTTISITERDENARQAVVNACCNYSNCDSIKGLEIGTQSLKKETDSEWILEMSGSYYPVDKYGDMGDKYLFDITVSVDKSTGYAYSTRDYIRKKY